MLRAAKLIELDVPPTLNQRGRETYAGHARVMCVTASGRATSGIRTRAPGNSADYFPRAKSAEPPGEWGYEDVVEATKPLTAAPVAMTESWPPLM